MDNKKFDLEDRLVKFARMCLDVCDLLPSSKKVLKLRNKIKSQRLSNFLFLIPKDRQKSLQEQIEDK